MVEINLAKRKPDPDGAETPEKDEGLEARRAPMADKSDTIVDGAETE